MNISELIDRTISNRGTHTKCGANQVRMCMRLGGKRPQQVTRTKDVLAFTIGEGLMQQQRWVCGDRVTLDLDCSTSTLTIRRVPNSAQSTMSWCLSAAGDRKLADKGRIVRTAFSICSTPKMLHAFGMDKHSEYIPKEVISDANGLSFVLPEKWTTQNH